MRRRPPPPPPASLHDDFRPSWDALTRPLCPLLFPPASRHRRPRRPVRREMRGARATSIPPRTGTFPQPVLGPRRRDRPPWLNRLRACGWDSPPLPPRWASASERRGDAGQRSPRDGGGDGPRPRGERGEVERSGGALGEEGGPRRAPWRRRARVSGPRGGAGRRFLRDGEGRDGHRPCGRRREVGLPGGARGGEGGPQRAPWSREGPGGGRERAGRGAVALCATQGQGQEQEWVRGRMRGW
mmetsp:Transcript_17191/g.38700  ORF Transcript_17191/g.38700 Transcript_17191/m.38700 type:complete len:242 (+) Transcript_17191:1203-1928(+)